MNKHLPNLSCGVAGWSYADWKDTVYRLPPPPQRQPELFDTRPLAGKAEYARDPLAYLAQFVDMIEVNSPFYRIPSPETVRSWSKRVAFKPGFFFMAKLNQAFTHEFRQDFALVSEYCRALAPLQEGGVLKGILAQFRYDFADSPEARRHLQWVTREFQRLAPLVMEVRHSSWEGPDAVKFFEELGVNVAALDYPLADNSFSADSCIAAPDFAYLRLHGRNRAAWFAKDVPVHEVYNYDYEAGEIAQLAERGQRLQDQAKHLIIVANNHYQGKAVSAALRLKAALQNEKIPIPPALLETYPHLRRIAL
jgi:uncharacterized protein YecE (DUF72 family)